MGRLWIFSAKIAKYNFDLFSAVFGVVKNVDAKNFPNGPNMKTN